MTSLPESVCLSDIKVIAKHLRAIAAESDSDDRIEAGSMTNQEYQKHVASMLSPQTCPVEALNDLINRHWRVGHPEHLAFMRKLMTAATAANLSAHTDALNTVAKALGFREWHALEGFFKKREKHSCPTVAPLHWTDSWQLSAHDVPADDCARVLDVMRSGDHRLLVFGWPGDAGVYRTAHSIAKTLWPDSTVQKRSYDRDTAISDRVLDVMEGKAFSTKRGQFTYPLSAQVATYILPGESMAVSRDRIIRWQGHFSPSIIVHMKARHLLDTEPIYDLWLRRESLPEPLDAEACAKCILAADGAPPADDLWMGRALCMIEALDGLRIDLKSPTLLNDIIAKQLCSPAITAFMDTTPGYNVAEAGQGMYKCREQLGYLAMQIRGLWLKACA